MSNRSDGTAGEQRAAQYLKKQGLKLLALNYRAANAEIDIIAKDRDTLVFAEVKSRRSERFGLGREAVTADKRAKIAAAASAYMLENGLSDAPARFDVVEVNLNSGQILHIKNAFITGE
ncbi:hypothetical protein SDC9_120647 [bioreactor metagenome]|uniref:Uncharacterized protein n=1 Tax=bioreactor metagenome TaxID=1076179 RepID=A0A645C7R2_9ZZZZ